jgi:hypothetical protein
LEIKNVISAMKQKNLRGGREGGNSAGESRRHEKHINGFSRRRQVSKRLNAG